MDDGFKLVTHANEDIEADPDCVNTEDIEEKQLTQADEIVNEVITYTQPINYIKSTKYFLLPQYAINSAAILFMIAASVDDDNKDIVMTLTIICALVTPMISLFAEYKYSSAVLQDQDQWPIDRIVELPPLPPEEQKTRELYYKLSTERDDVIAEFHALEAEVEVLNNRLNELMTQEEQFSDLVKELQILSKDGEDVMDIVDKSNYTFTKMNNLIYHNERTYLLTIYYQIAFRDKDVVMNKEEYEGFLLQIPKIYSPKFRNLGNFEYLLTKYGSENDGINVQNFSMMVDDVLASSEDVLKEEFIREFSAVSISKKTIEDKDIIKQQMKKYTLEKKNTLHQQHLPLHKFTPKNIADKIKHWTYNDINYKSGLLKTMKIFSKHSLSGQSISVLTANSAKLIVKNDLLTFMTSDTLDIMFNYFDKWKSQNIDEMKSKSAPEIACIVYHYPLHQLLTTIIKQDVNGTKFIKQLETNGEFVKKHTGWKSTDIYQINSILFKHSTPSSRESMNNMMNYMNDIPNIMKEKIQQTVSKFDVETLHYKIKQNRCIEEFSDAMINFVDELIEYNETNKQKNKQDSYLDEDFVNRIYHVIANCFISPILNTNIVTFHTKNEWICHNCSNQNFIKYMGSKLCGDIKICSLCGIQQINSIILKIQNYETFFIINEVDGKHDENEIKQDDTVDLIELVLEREPMDLSCLSRNDNQPCPSFIRLAKQLIKYKRWLYTVYQQTQGQDNIDKTIQIDICKYIENHTYKKIFIESAKNIKKINDNHVQSIVKMLEDNIENIAYLKVFISLKRKQFAKMLKKHMKLTVANGSKLYKNIKRLLKENAQTKQFGQFLTDLDMKQIEQDYHHIIQSHINHGNQTTIKNTFRFFEKVVHFEDKESETKECRSYKRREQRVESSNLRNTHEIKEQKESINSKNAENNDSWTLKQYYMQSQLDIIHSYLVHSNWKYFVQRYSNTLGKDDETQCDDYKTNKSDQILVNAANTENKTKYITNSSKSNASTYGFGVDHSYAHLTDIFCSVYHEMLCNKLCSISEEQFQRMLIKAVQMHNIAVSDNYKDELICKYWNEYYNILRNEPIGIRHILSLIIYTDISKFCTEYRKTYRRIDEESKDEHVTERNKQLYHYSRNLFEAIEFFGQYMKPALKVYHGLNKVMMFEKFTSYFNQPISTTTSLATALQFSDGAGILLTLKSGAAHFNDLTKIPKYLPVSWMSDFPHEDEYLFYGLHVVFKIVNITEASNLKGHTAELQMFNKFQKTVHNKQNKEVKWDENDEEEKKMIKALVILIKHEKGEIKEDDVESDTDEKEDKKKENDTSDLYGKYITKYGKQLFHYFCTNKNTTQMTIREFQSLPNEIYKHLFIELNANKNNSESRMSLLPISKLFPYLKQISLINLNINHLTIESKQYVEAVMEYINMAKEKTQLGLEKIVFQSKKQQDNKINATLKKLETRYMNKFSQLKWKIEYILQDTHQLTFINYNYNTQTLTSHIGINNNNV